MNNSKIYFYNFNIKTGYIKLRYKIFDSIINEDGDLYFKLTPAIIPRNDLIAVALSTLCYRNYCEIKIDLTISPYIIREIENFTLAKISTIGFVEDYITKTKNNITLNFSGGFDSLAALYLMPEETNLVSMDFGGRFSREKKYFQKYNTHIVETNLINTELKKNSWAFMGIASILFSECLGTHYHTFGGILEASSNNLSNNPYSMKNISFPPFKIIGIQNAPYVLGLTEVGTIKVLMHYAKDKIYESLESLASPGEEKRYRKQVLCNIYSKKLGIDVKINNIQPPIKPHYKFGQNFAVDFLSLYIMKNAGYDIASHTLYDIPTEAIDLSNNLSLDFYEKLNTNFLENFPTDLLGNMIKKLSDAGILPYTENDWKEFAEVRNLFEKYYKID